MLSQRICDEANARISEIMPDNNIRISSINKSLRLDQKAGGSIGETLSVGYAFLSTLLRQTQHQLPFVVDSPSGPIDLKIRPQIAKLIPKISDQAIAFTISSEKKSFLDPLLEETNSTTHLLTLIRKGNSELDSLAIATEDCIETSDGLLVSSKDYFENFHEENE